MNFHLTGLLGGFIGRIVVKHLAQSLPGSKCCYFKEKQDYAKGRRAREGIADMSSVNSNLGQQPKREWADDRHVAVSFYFYFHFYFFLRKRYFESTF